MIPPYLILCDRVLRVGHHAFVILLVVASAIVLTAQTVVDPRYVEFTPSADHNTLGGDGAPLVQRYSLSVFVVGSSVPFDTMDLGKPAPSGGVIRVDFLPLLHSVPAPGVVFEARVIAIGPGGSTGSSASNGFSFTQPCAPSINSTGQSVGAGVTTGSVGVTAGTGCTWTAVSNASWITVTSGASGSGNGSAGFSVAANPNTSTRSGTLTIASRTFTVTQAASGCSILLTPTSLTMTGVGGTGSITVGTSSGCAWAASTTQAWITVSGSGTASGSASYTVQPNTGTGSRTGTINIGTQAFTISQSNLTPPVTPVSPQGLRIVGGR